ncbi:MAG: putative deoxyribonuclease YjjV [Bacteroidota bacterium]|jgi:TatD DNase family protein
MTYFDAHSHRRSADPSTTTLVCVRINALTEVFETDGICTVGLHPWDVTEDWRDIVEIVEDLTQEELVKGIGEVGLDRSCNAPWQHQVDAFEYIADMAERVSKPLVIHCVKAHDELLRVHKFVNPVQPWVLHGFVKGADLARQCLDAGMYLSFGPAVFKESASLIEALKICPSDRLLVETDDEDASIAQVYASVANVRGITTEELCAIQQQNFETVFKR